MFSKRHLLTGGSALFALTAVGAHAQDNAGRQPTILQIPLTIDARGGVLIDLFFGDKGPYRFALDTGAATAAIRDDLARTLKLPVVGVMAGASLAGFGRNAVYSGRDVRLGGILKLPTLPMSALDKTPEGIFGRLPAAIITDPLCELDYEGAMLRYYLGGASMDLTGFSRLDSTSPTDGSGVVPGGIYVRLKLDGSGLRCLADTGASRQQLLLSGAYVQTHDLWRKHADAPESLIAGANGERVKIRVATLPNFEFGAAHFDQIRVTLIDPDGHDNLLHLGVDGLVGSDLLRQFTLAFKDHEVYVKPNGSWKAE
jgi:predicted aspartyl protease